MALQIKTNVNDNNNNNNSKTSYSSSKKSLFNYETLDPDLPNFTSTKRLSLSWKTLYVLFFMIFSSTFFISPICIACNSDDQISYFCLLIGSLSYVVCACMEWWHYHRGCCSYSNLNSRTKTNIDRSLLAVLNRGKVGCLHFIMLLMSCCIFADFILLYLKGLMLYGQPKEDTDEAVINYYIHIVFACSLVVLSLAQIVKFERIANPTKQYIMMNDFSNFFVGWFFLSGIFVYSLGAISYVLKGENDLFDTCGSIHIYMSICGGTLLIMSGVSEIIRFFCSDDSDLNNSEESSKYSI